MRHLLVLSALLAAVAGCGRPPPPPPCPEILVDRQTAQVTQFRPGPGRDITDIVLQVEVAAIEGACTYDFDDERLILSINVAFVAELGPAAETRQPGFRYFVAVPAFHPDPAGKAVFDVTTDFPPNVSTVLHRDELLELDLPVPYDPSRSVPQVFVGLQLTPAELEYNRRTLP